MTKLSVRSTSLLAAVAAAALLAGCASGKGPTPTSFDFGPATPPAATQPTAPQPATTPAGSAFPALVIAPVTGAASLDSERMYYRLLYANAQQSLPYAYNRWAATPLELLSQRLRTRIAQGGVKVLSTTDATGGLPLLRIEADEFSQNFASATQSSASVTLRASLFRDHQLVDQRTFARSTPATSADAAGGAGALAASTDAIAADILAWLATQPPR